MFLGLLLAGCGLVLNSGNGGDDDDPSLPLGGGSEENEGSGSSNAIPPLSIDTCTEVGSQDLDAPLGDLALDNGYVFGFAKKSGSCAGLLVWDVALPDTPIPVPNGLQGVCGERTVAQGGVLYTHNLAAGLLLAVDVTTPSAPSTLGSIAVDAGALAAGSGHVYVQAPFELHVVDFSQPTQPVSRPSLRGWGEDIAVAGDRAYVAGGSARLRVYSLTDPAAPMPTVSVGDGNSPAPLALGEGVAYVADDSGLYVFDLSDPAVPEAAGFYLSSYLLPSDLALLGTRLFLVIAGGMEIFDVANPAAPVLLESVKNSGIEHVAAVNGRLYVVSNGYSDGKLQVLSCN